MFWRVRNLAGSRIVAADTLVEAVQASRMADVCGAELLTEANATAAELVYIAWGRADPDELYDYSTLADTMDISERLARDVLYELHATGMLHVADWIPAPAQGQARPLYAMGAGQDAPRPSMSHQELRQRRLEHHAAARQARTVEKPVTHAADAASYTKIALNWKAPTK